MNLVVAIITKNNTDVDDMEDENTSNVAVAVSEQGLGSLADDQDSGYDSDTTELAEAEADYEMDWDDEKTEF